MPRKMIVVQGDGSTSTVLTEILADNEAQLQERMKNTPDLLPVDEFDMTGPLLVIGRETRLPSGLSISWPWRGVGNYYLLSSKQAHRTVISVMFLPNCWIMALTSGKCRSSSSRQMSFEHISRARTVRIR